MKSALIAQAGPVASVLTALLLTAGGCANQQKPSNASVLDVPYSKSPYGAADANYAPPQPQPYAGSLANYPAAGSSSSGYSAAPAPVEPAITQTPSYAPTPAPSQPAGGTYVVKKGDTLFHIARERYGDGKQWQRIAAANPGVSPSSLKVGQKIVVP